MGPSVRRRRIVAAKSEVEEWCLLTGVLKGSFLLLFGN